MPKGRLKRLEGLKEALQEILQENDHPTTNKIQKLAEEKGFTTTWSTIKDYLDGLETEGKAKKMTFGDDYKVITWQKTELTE